MIKISLLSVSVSCISAFIENTSWPRNITDRVVEYLTRALLRSCFTHLRLKVRKQTLQKKKSKSSAKFKYLTLKIDSIEFWLPLQSMAESSIKYINLTSLQSMSASGFVRSRQKRELRSRRRISGPKTARMLLQKLSKPRVSGIGKVVAVSCNVETQIRWHTKKTYPVSRIFLKEKKCMYYFMNLLSSLNWIDLEKRISMRN